MRLMEFFLLLNFLELFIFPDLCFFLTLLKNLIQLIYFCYLILLVSCMMLVLTQIDIFLYILYLDFELSFFHLVQFLLTNSNVKNWYSIFEMPIFSSDPGIGIIGLSLNIRGLSETKKAFLLEFLLIITIISLNE